MINGTTPAGIEPLIFAPIKAILSVIVQLVYVPDPTTDVTLTTSAPVPVVYVVTVPYIKLLLLCVSVIAVPGAIASPVETVRECDPVAIVMLETDRRV